MQATTTATNGGRTGLRRSRRPSPARAEDPNGKPRCLRIAVADDDPAVCRFHQRVLSQLGHQVCVAHTGRQLVEQCRLLHPDLIIAGVMLPDLDGVAAIEEICRDQPTPIILVSGKSETEVVERARPNQYVLAWLFKPLKEADLGPAIAVVMSRFERFESVRRQAAELRRELEDRKLIERAKGLVMRYAGLNEEEAYYRLRKTASDQNRKLVEIARAVLAAEEVFH